MPLQQSEFPLPPPAAQQMSHRSGVCDPEPTANVRWVSRVVVDRSHSDFLPWRRAARKVQRWWRDRPSMTPGLPRWNRPASPPSIEVLDTECEAQREEVSRATRLAQEALRRAHLG